MEVVSVSDDGGSPPAERRITSRRKKSAAQVEILERLYTENKYPSEEVRANWSAQLGLSEKQMQVWFIHRRHKDRKDGVEDVKLTFYAMRHKGGEAHLDFMEEMNSGKRTGSVLGRDDTLFNGDQQPSPGTIGEISNGHFRRFDSESENSGLGEANDTSVNGFKPSAKRGSLVSRKERGYKRPMTMPPKSKVLAKELEAAMISTVEVQLGGSIRMDGPLLGMEFDSLPANAWAHLAPTAPVSTRGGRVQSVGTY